jgi:hypothetical protein
VDILHKRGPSGLSLPAPAKKDQKPSDHWRGTIDLLLCIVQVGSEADLPDAWSAWAPANKKEHWNILQERLQETAVLLGYPQPVATGELTQILVNLQFISPGTKRTWSRDYSPLLLVITARRHLLSSNA